jgi:hypothetical protein
VNPPCLSAAPAHVLREALGERRTGRVVAGSLVLYVHQGAVIAAGDAPRVTPETIDAFQDAVAAFLGAAVPPRFEPLDAPPIPEPVRRMQAGLLDRCARMWDRASGIALDASLRAVVLGPDDDTLGSIILRAFDGGDTVEHVLAALPCGPVTGRARIADLLANGDLEPVPVVRRGFAALAFAAAAGAVVVGVAAWLVGS